MNSENIPGLSVEVAVRLFYVRGQNESCRSVAKALKYIRIECLVSGS